MNKLVEYLIKQLSKTKIFEMTYSREQYIDNIDDIADQIVENWCLIRYCTLYDKDNKNKVHWKQELKSYCKKLLRSVVKVNKLKATQDAMIEMLELDNQKIVEVTIADKFEKENFEIKQDICRDFSEYGLQKIIYLVSKKFSNTSYQELYRYIDEDI